MALASDLIGLGLPPELAVFLGQSDLTPFAAAGTSQGTATLLTASFANVTTASGKTGLILNASSTLTRLFFIRNSPSSTLPLVIYPPGGGSINGGATNAGITIPVGGFALVQYEGTTLSYAALTSNGVNGIPSAGALTASPRTIAVGGLVPAVSTDFTDSTPSATVVNIGEVLVPCNMTVTGVANFSGSVASGNLKVGLADSTGAIVATSASTAMVGTDAYQRVPFTAAANIIGPATYYILTFYDNGTARYNSPPLGTFGAAQQTGQVYATGFTTITPPTTFTTNVAPIASLY